MSSKMLRHVVVCAGRRVHSRAVHSLRLPLHATRNCTAAGVGAMVNTQMMAPRIMTALYHSTVPAQKKIPFLLTDIGEGIAEVELLQWFVKEGDSVKQFDQICEVQSDKATVEITSRYDGKITKLYYAANDMAQTGTPLVDIEIEGDDDDVEEEAPAAQPATDTSASTAQTTTASDSSSQTHSTYKVDEKILTTPAVRRLAREHALDLSLVTATGKNGRIMKEDVLAYLSGDTTAAPASDAGSHSTTTVVNNKASADTASYSEPVRGLQRMMIKTMNESLTIPHFGYHEEVDVTNLMQLREEMKELAIERGTRMTMMPLFIKSMSLALKNYPVLNSELSPCETEITYHRSHNIGVAMDTPQGLIVPSVKNVQQLTLLEVAQELENLKALGVNGKLGPDELSNTTITLSNIGNVGGTYMRPVIVPPQVAICAMGAVQKLPRFDDDGNVVAARIVQLSWSGDHRIIDGATMARFCSDWKRFLENPRTMLMEMS
eukprot:GFYU01005077.1.p1 GENE.GFYU01005077.1~~GFYU01005077.1.p1  ORF type:complete len:491 (-),score=160.07 GFYU01005077.1:116-1588(-)